MNITTNYIFLSAFLFVTMSTLLSMEKTDRELSGISQKEYLFALSTIIKHKANEYTKQGYNLSDFKEKWRSFEDRVETLCKLNIYDAEPKRDYKNIFSFNKSFLLPFLSGLKTKFYEPEDDSNLLNNPLKYGASTLLIKNQKDIDWVLFPKEGCRKNEKSLIIKDEVKLFSQEFINKCYSGDNAVIPAAKKFLEGYIAAQKHACIAEATNKNSIEWGLLPGQCVFKEYKDLTHFDKHIHLIQSYETIDKSHYKYTSILLIPGVSFITNQTPYSQMLALSYAYLAVRCFGIKEYQKMLMNAYKNRVSKDVKRKNPEIKSLISAILNAWGALFDVFQSYVIKNNSSEEKFIQTETEEKSFCEIDIVAAVTMKLAINKSLTQREIIEQFKNVDTLWSGDMKKDNK